MPVAPACALASTRAWGSPGAACLMPTTAPPSMADAKNPAFSSDGATKFCRGGAGGLNPLRTCATRAAKCSAPTPVPDARPGLLVGGAGRKRLAFAGSAHGSGSLDDAASASAGDRP